MLWYFYPYDHPDIFNSTSKSHFDTAVIPPPPALHPNDPALHLQWILYPQL